MDEMDAALIRQPPHPDPKDPLRRLPEEKPFAVLFSTFFENRTTQFIVHMDRSTLRGKADVGRELKSPSRSYSDPPPRVSGILSCLATSTLQNMFYLSSAQLPERFTASGYASGR
jgi:hypothetical protein